jgi:four helix bundle protein
MTELELKKRTKQFAHSCVKVALNLVSNQLGNHISSQLIRCSTSVAANYRATCVAQSTASFIAKLGIVIEEVDETSFWLEFIIDEQLINKELVESLFRESNELTAIFIASRKTLQQNAKNKK